MTQSKPTRDIGQIIVEIHCLIRDMYPAAINGDLDGAQRMANDAGTLCAEFWNACKAMKETRNGSTLGS